MENKIIWFFATLGFLYGLAFVVTGFYYVFTNTGNFYKPLGFSMFKLIHLQIIFLAFILFFLGLGGDGASLAKSLNFQSIIIPLLIILLSALSGMFIGWLLTRGRKK
jgi:hypothetical protein